MQLLPPFIMDHARSLAFQFVNGRLRLVWLAAGVVGTTLATFLLGGQIQAGLTYRPAIASVATIQWMCERQKEPAFRPCSRPEAKRLQEASGARRARLDVTFRFAAESGAVHTLTAPFGRTGLSLDEAVPGARFELLYDPADPARTSIPFGNDKPSIIAGLFGLAALLSYAAVFWMGAGQARRAWDVPA
jgi:hypothetical protein